MDTIFVGIKNKVSYLMLMIVCTFFFSTIIETVSAQLSSDTNVTVQINSLADVIRVNSEIDGVPISTNVGNIINITVTVRTFGNLPLSGQTVTLNVSGLPGAVLVGPTMPTNAAGQTTATLTSSIAGNFTVTGIVTTYPGNPIAIDDDFQGSFTSSGVAPEITVHVVAGDDSDPYIDQTDDSYTLVEYTTSPLASQCKWDIIDTDYDSMSDICASVTECVLNLSGEGAKTVYMRCEDAAGLKALSSYVLNYTIEIPSTPPPPPPPPPPVCTPQLPQIRTLSCPTGQTGMIIEHRSSVCPGPIWGLWTVITNTCTTTPPIVPPVEPPVTPPVTPPSTPPVPSTEIVKHYVPIIGWTFPNSNVSIENGIDNQTSIADLDGLFENMVLFPENLGDIETQIRAYFAELGINPKDIRIIVDQDTIKRGDPVYVLMPPTLKTEKNSLTNNESNTIKGTSAPNIDISLYMYNENDFRVYNLRSDEYGFWKFDYTNDLPAGKYTIYAVGTNEYGYSSAPSNLVQIDIYTPVKPTEVTAPSSTPIIGGLQRYEQIVKEDVVVKNVQVLQNVNYWVAIGLVGFSLFGLIFELFSLILFILNNIASWLGLIPKKEPWGTVYDSETKEGVDLAIVRLYDAKTKKYLQSHVTDKNGRYGFLVKKGKYLIQVTKNNYTFPARGEYGDYDGRYNHLYFGGVITVDEDDQNVDFNIPITPKETIKQQIIRENKYHTRKIRYYLGKTSFPLLAIGFVLSILVSLVYGGLLNYFVTLTYLLSIVYQIYRMSIQLKPWGVIYESKTGTPVPMATVKIIDPEYNRILETKLTDYDGRFSFLVTPGKYIIKVDKEGYNFPTRACKTHKDKKHVDWYCGQKFVIKSEKQSFINIDIPIDGRI